MTITLTGREHDLKIWPPYYAAVDDDRKPWEFRLDDRAYKVGDVLNLHEWDPNTQSYTGRWCARVVTFILHGGFKIPDGYVVMSLAHLPRVPMLAPKEGNENSCPYGGHSPVAGARCPYCQWVTPWKVPAVPRGLAWATMAAGAAALACAWWAR